jgi:drug/metabolite transporter (DMT)-like permease
MTDIAKTGSLLGIVYVIGASVAFSLNDVGIKFLSGDYPLHEVVLVRACVALIITLAFFIPLEGGLKNLRTNKLKLHLLRGLFVVFANVSFFLGLASISLPEATAIFFVSPLVITLFSVIFLREYVGVWRWFAVIVGLLGTLVMLRPTSGAFQLAALFPLGAAVGYASLHILTRKMGGTEKASTMAVYIQIVFVVVSASMGIVTGDGRYAGSDDPSWEFLFRAWSMPTTTDFFVMFVVGCASAFGGYMVSQAYRLTPAALIAPFEYVALLLAIIWGITLFGEWPDAVAWIGIGLILFGGLFLVWREAVRKTAGSTRRPMPRHR